jgi:cell wall-associated NlpC family hydrolase
MTEAWRSAVVEEAKTWLGTPYHHKAAVRGGGIDCAHLLIEVYSAVGLVPKVDPGDYAPQWHLHRSEEIFLGWIKRYADMVDSPQIGDVGMWRFGRCWSHGSILIGPQMVIHSYVGRGVIMTRVDESPLAGRPVGWWSVRG